MMHGKNFLTKGVLVASALLMTTQLRAQANTATNIVTTESGKVQGSVKDGVLAFKGIPFAAPPLAQLRWRAPQPVTPWTGVRDTTEYALDCDQLPFPSDAAPLGAGTSEDCLYMNVWKPAAPPPVGSKSAKLPVMVWIYGGGFVNGGSSPLVYSGHHFAENGIVFVSFNYRVGRFGFFGFPALTAEHPEELHGNYGYMDQIAALKWVQRNIAAFGGDPSQVTVFGESAGGGSVLTLLTSPLSQGLYQRAVIESGGGRSLLLGPKYLSQPGPDGSPSAETLGVNFAKENGITDTGAAGLAQLRALPADKIVNGLNMASMFQAANTYSGPIVDGAIVVESPQSAIVAGRWAKVPIIIGANSMDIGFPHGRTMDELFAPFGTNEEKAKALYNPDHSDNVMLVGMRIAADQMMVEPSRFVSRTVSGQGIPAYEYRFSYVAESLRDKYPGAPHATEIPYVFDTVDVVYKDKLTPADEAMAKKVHSYWVAFAKSGNPSAAGPPSWETQNSQTDFLMNFTNTGIETGGDHWKARLDLVEVLAAEPTNAAAR
jgi:para-nitrobenzyl esterase